MLKILLESILTGFDTLVNINFLFPYTESVFGILDPLIIPKFVLIKYCGYQIQSYYAIRFVTIV